MNENDIYHHGIKGMKWGVRRTAEQLGHKIREAKKANAERIQAEKEAGIRQYSRKELAQLSDRDLEQLNRRLQMRSQYDSYFKKENQNRIDKGQSVIKKIWNKSVVDVGTKTTSALLTKIAEDLFDVKLQNNNQGNNNQGNEKKKKK